MDTLDAILSTVSETAPTVENIEIDITLFHPSGKKTVLWWKRPTVGETYGISNDAQTLIKRFPEWNDIPQLAFNVATMAACHMAPAGNIPAWLFYAKLVNANWDLHFYLVDQIKAHFPGLLSPKLLEKKASSEPSPDTSADTP